jgi:hypothetical protein
MKRYKYVIRKTQDSTVEIEANPDQTVGEITEKLEKMTEEELGFDEPQYHLIAISREDHKISKIIWRCSSF